MSQRILIASYEVPGWGGAGTACYSLFEMLQKDGRDVHLINIISEHDAAYFAQRFGDDIGNPRELENVSNCCLTGNNYGPQAGARDWIAEIDPDVMLGVGWIAAYVLGKADPARRLIYLTSGCGWLGIYSDMYPGRDYLSVSETELASPRGITREDALEEEAIEMADLVVGHSDINLRLYRAIYSGHAGKMYERVIWFSQWIEAEAHRHRRCVRTFDEREIDVLFVANDWSRPIKGFPLMKAITDRLPSSLEVHVVGELPGAGGKFHHHDFLADRGKLFDLMGNSRVVVSPSAYDAAPGVLFEAAAMGCNVVASKNCGNWALCPPGLLADPPTPKSYARCIARGVEKACASDTQRFNGTRSYEDLRDLLDVF